jgi:antirestriction protein ArdC
LTRGRGWATPRFVTFKQAQEAGGSVRKGEHGTKVYFVKQLRVREGEGEDKAERLVPMMREYTVFNVAQCEGFVAKPSRPNKIGELPTYVSEVDLRTCERIGAQAEAGITIAARIICPQNFLEVSLGLYKLPLAKASQTQVTMRGHRFPSFDPNQSHLAADAG